MILTGWMIHSSLIAYILLTKETLRVGILFNPFFLLNIQRILLRFGKINGDIQNTIFGIHLPSDIFIHSIPSNIVGGDSHVIVSIGGCFGGYFIIPVEFCDNITWLREKAIHN